MCRKYIAQQLIFSIMNRTNNQSNLEEGTELAHTFLLSTREKEVLQLITEGYTTAKMARELFVSHHTIISHRKNMMKKLQVVNMAGLTRKGAQFFNWQGKVEPQKITLREKEILKLVAFEYTTEMIASELLISPHTVIKHRKNLKKKLLVKNAASLVRKGMEMGFLEVNS